MINSVLSCCNARFVCFDLNVFNLQTQMNPPDYVHIKLLDITQEFIEEYNLMQLIHNEWIYFEILWGCYSLPQSVSLTNNLLLTRIERSGY